MSRSSDQAPHSYGPDAITKRLNGRDDKAEPEMDAEHARTVGDALSIGTVVGAIVGWLPAVAALFTIIWTAIRIYETRTCQNLIRWIRR